MIDKRRAMTASATLLIAAAAGHFMQFGDAIAERVSSARSQKEMASAASVPVRQLAALPTPPIEMIMPGDLSQQSTAPVSRVAAVNFTIDTVYQSDASVPPMFQTSCNVKLTALPEPGAMVRLQLDAPCYRNQRIMVEHLGLEFADVVGEDGTYTIDVPAFHEYRKFSVTFADGTTVDAKTLALMIDGYDRVAISWQGGPGIHIHALEYDAGYGDAGHVWANAARDVGAGVRAEGGFLIQLGNPDVLNPRLAEVYSFPYDRVPEDGTVRLIVEAEVTPATCGKEIKGRMIQLSAEGDMSTMNISLAMPDCGGDEGFLMLKNLLQDLKIVRN
ncbi:MAG: hypothetical protein ACU0DI_10370 [Paracoccaceae bacterium]